MVLEWMTHALQNMTWVVVESVKSLNQLSMLENDQK